MGYEWLAAFSLVKSVAAFAFFFIYLPRKIFPQRPDSPAIDRFFENLVLMASTAIIFAHLLALMQIYSIITVLLGYLLLYGAGVWYRENSFPLQRFKNFVVQKIVLTLDVLDRVVDLKAGARERLRKIPESWQELARERQRLTHVILFGAVLLYAGALRYADLFRSPAFGYSDPYSHLLWMKQLESGILYPVGDRNQYYPKGFHAFAAILHGLTGLDGALSLRLVGPLVGVLLVVCVYYVGKKLTQSGEAALIGMFIFGTFFDPIIFLNSYFEDGMLVSGDLYPRWFVRQTAALPEEFALVFLMPALFAAHSYLTERTRRSFILFCLAAIAIFMTHPLISVALGVGWAALVSLSFLLRVSDRKSLKALTAAAVVTALLGNLQLLYGWLFDHSVETAAEHYATVWLGSFERAGPMPYTLEILISATLGLLFFLGGLLFARGKSRKLLWAFFGLFLLLLAFLGRSVNFGIRYLIGPDRLDHYRIFLLCGAAAGVYSVATLFPLFGEWYRKRRWIYQTMAASALMALGVIGFPSELPAPPRYEYDSLAAMSYRIKRSFPPLEWTIVSTTEDYSKILKDKGWHMNVGDFVERYDPYEKNSDLPTPYLFLFVEKRLFGASADPALNGAGVRLDLERRLLEWSSIYNILHDDMSIYYEDWDVIVYLIDRNRSSNNAKIARVAKGPAGFAGTFGDGLKKLSQGWGS